MLPFSIFTILTSCSLAHAATLISDVEARHAVDGCCQSLSQKLPGKVSFPGSTIFEAEVNSYYSKQESDLVAQCRVSPTSAQDVSLAVQILTAGHCQFSVRSAGHMTWAGAANIAGPGIAIDLKSMNSTTVSADGTFATVLPGASWGPVYDALDPYNLTVVGGRSNTVGVGGFLLGGGFSNLSPQYGFASDNIINYEIVLSNGSIIDVNITSNPDLYWGLKAGSTNFGIITRYDLKTYPLVPMWGGFRGYNVSQGKDIFDAMAQFTVKLREEPKGGASVVWAYDATSGNDTISASFAYLGINGSDSPAQLYSDMLAVPFVPGTETLRTTNQQGLDEEVDVAFPGGFRREFTTLTFKVDSQLAVDIYSKTHDEMAPFVGKPGISWAASFQPIDLTMLQAIENNGVGGTPQGLTPEAGDLILLNLNAVWVNASDDDSIQAALKNVIDWATDAATERGLLNPWLYINYATPIQPVYEGYPEVNVNKLKVLKAQYDPDDILGNLWKGGFKF